METRPHLQSFSMEKTELHYWKDTYCFASFFKVQTFGEDPKGFYVIPSSTIFYPGGGGQEMDFGYITINKEEIRIVGADYNDGYIKHYLETKPDHIALEAETAMTILGTSRLYAAALHSAGHWIAGIVTEGLKLKLIPTKAYHYSEGPYIEFSGDSSVICQEILDQINMNLLIDGQARLKVSCEITNQINTTGKLFRTVTIETYSPIGCGGTHIANLSEMKSVVATKICLKNGKIRISYKVEVYEPSIS